MILITQYMERFEVHPEGSDICDADSRDTVELATPYSFRDLIDLIRFGEPSSSPASGDAREWVTQYETNNGTRDYFETGARENTSIHYDRTNPGRNAKWWRLAFKVAGLIKGSAV